NGRAQLNVTGLSHTHCSVAEALARSSSHGAVLLETPQGVRLSEQRIRSARVSEHWSAAAARELLAVEGASPERMYWAPARRLLLDRATRAIRLDEHVRWAESLGGAIATGQGVVVGFADSGVDFEHRDLQNADGTTRVAWFIDFAASPYGRYPELEREFGCEDSEEFSCGILSAVEI